MYLISEIGSFLSKLQIKESEQLKREDNSIYSILSDNNVLMVLNHLENIINETKDSDRIVEVVFTSNKGINSINRILASKVYEGATKLYDDIFHDKELKSLLYFMSLHEYINNYYRTSLQKYTYDRICGNPEDPEKINDLRGLAILKNLLDSMEECHNGHKSEWSIPKELLR